jgi:hypothetical protein
MQRRLRHMTALADDIARLRAEMGPVAAYGKSDVALRRVLDRCEELERDHDAYLALRELQGGTPGRAPCARCEVLFNENGRLEQDSAITRNERDAALGQIEQIRRAFYRHGRTPTPPLTVAENVEALADRCETLEAEVRTLRNVAVVLSEWADEAEHLIASAAPLAWVHGEPSIDEANTWEKRARDVLTRKPSTTAGKP